MPTQLVKENEKLLTGGDLVHYHCPSTFLRKARKPRPFSVLNLKPIQMPSMNMDEVFSARAQFTTPQWMDVLLLRSVGMEPTNLDERVKWHLVTRMIPFVENNYNVCELGPRGTGEKPCLQGVFTELSACFGRTNHRCQPVL